MLNGGSSGQGTAPLLFVISENKRLLEIFFHDGQEYSITLTMQHMIILITNHPDILYNKLLHLVSKFDKLQFLSYINIKGI